MNDGYSGISPYLLGFGRCKEHRWIIPVKGKKNPFVCPVCGLKVRMRPHRAKVRGKESQPVVLVR